MVTWGCPSISSHSFYCDLLRSHVTQAKLVRKAPRRNAALTVMLNCNQDLSFLKEKGVTLFFEVKRISVGS